MYNVYKIKKKRVLKKMEWIYMTPPDFRAAVKNDGLCVVPMGPLERHGEHGYLGTDGLTAQTIAIRAAEKESAVVFPTWWYCQVHEAACFEGSVNFPPEMLISMLRQLLSQIAGNGFKKICIMNVHGGNCDWLRFFDISTLDERRGYCLYIMDLYSCLTDDEREKIDRLWPDGQNHAGEAETSVSMACVPPDINFGNQIFTEPIKPLGRLKHLKGISSALGWYADYPENVTGNPSRASKEKGNAALDCFVEAAARTFKNIKRDTEMPKIQREFLNRRK